MVTSQQGMPGVSWLARLRRRLRLAYALVSAGVPVFWALRFQPTRPQPLPPSFDVFDGKAWDEFWRKQLNEHSPPLTLYHFEEPVRTVLARMRADGARSVLSVGCGICLDARAFAAAGYSVTGLDVSPVALKYARESSLPADLVSHFLDASELRPGGTVEFVQGDLFEPTCCRGPYDVVLCRDTIQYFEYAGRLPTALEAVSARLASGGLLVLTSHGMVSAFYSIDDWLKANGFRLVNNFYAEPTELFREHPAELVAWHTRSTG